MNRHVGQPPKSEAPFHDHPTRRELLTLIEEVSAACPEYRFGQLILNLAFLAREGGDQHAWDVEDAGFIEAARKHLADWYACHDQPDQAFESDPALARACLVNRD